MKPLICNYYLTYRCNARCSFCSIWEDTSVPARLESSPDIVCQNLSDARKLGVKFVDFTGGEPLLYRGFDQVLAYAKKIGLRTTVTTNGILYPNMAEKLPGLIDILQFSIAGADEASNDNVRGVKTFESILDSVRAARAHKQLPTFIHTVTDDNIEQVPGMIELARGLDVPLFLNPCFSYQGNGGISGENASKIRTLSREKLVTADHGYIAFVVDGGNRTQKPYCLAVSSVIVISPDNKLLLPCFHHNIRQIPIEGKLVELYGSPEVIKEKKKEGIHPFCEGCTVYCYMRASLLRKMNRYAFLSILSGMKYYHTLKTAKIC